jgi:nicotinic acid phosphoribosyltransferase
MGANASIPAAVLTDSYKASHYLMYPPAKKMMAYGEFRGPFEKDKTDTRFVFYGIRHALESIVLTPWTMETIELAGKFFATHNAGASDFPFPRDLLTRVVEEHDGYLPVKIEALPEGTVANARVPVYQITAEGDFARLVTFLETILTQVWYPTCVATLSRRAKELIRAAFETSVDADGFAALDSRLHDFGFRGCSSVEQSVIGGTAHLLNFTGTDTMSAAYHAQYALNEGRPVGFSIPATEHSVMTAWPSEEDAIRNMIDRFGGPGKVFSIVMDSYDYERAIFEILPRVAEHHLAKGGVFVIRPDSGDPIQCVLQALDACEKAFGATVNAKGYKVRRRCSRLQFAFISLLRLFFTMSTVRLSSHFTRATPR